MFTFEPVFKDYIWGGSAMLLFKGLSDVPDSQSGHSEYLSMQHKTIAESWELSHIDKNFSIVANGSMTGQTIDDLIINFGEHLLGKNVKKRFGHTFPLLIKFIDANDNLSIQVHPNDQLAQQRHQSFGKTEMWYVVKATPDAFLYSGFSQQIDADEYVRRIKDNRILDVLKKYSVKAGDVFFLPAGRIHAIGSGCFVAEIQQTSNITYRIYDYKRKDASGNERPLHTEWAKDAIDYTVYPDYKTHYNSIENEAVKLVQCPYFTTNLLNITLPIHRNYASLESFIIYICTRGRAILTDNKSNTLPIRQGQVVLIPANTNHLTLEPTEPATFLETYIDD